MPYENPESVGLKYQTIYDLSGGMVTNRNFYKVQRNQTKRILNGDLTTDGCVAKRRGRIKLNDTAFSGNPTVLSLATLGQSNNADLILAGAGDTLREVSTGVEVTVKTGLTPDAFLSSVAYDNYLFYANGVDQPFITQGSAATTYPWGIAAVTSLAGFTVAATAGGNGTAGTHRLTFRYRSSITGARSNPLISGSPLTIQSTSVTLAAGNLTYSITFPIGLVSPDTQVDQIDYFVQEAGAVGDGPYYYLGSSSNIAGVYSFGANISDDELIIKETLDVDDLQPVATLTSVEQWRGRVMGIIDDYNVGYSKQRVDANGFVNLPTSMPATNALEVGFGDGDPLVKIMVFNDYVFAFKRRSIWILLGDFDSANFGFKRLKANYVNTGLLNSRAIVQAGERIFFVSDDLKFFWFSITDFSTTELRLKDPPPSEAIGDLFRTFASSYRNNVNLVHNNFAATTQIWISFSDGSSGLVSSENFNVFVYDYTSDNGAGAWHIHTGIEIASSVLARDNNRDYFLYTGDYYGFVWKHTETDGDGALINGTSTGSNTVNLFNDTTQSFTSSLIGTFVTIIGGTGDTQVRRIEAVPSATQVQVTPDFSTVPDNTSLYTIGGINFQVWSRDDWCDEETPPDFDKCGWYLDLDIEAAGQSDPNDPGVISFTVLIVKDRNNSVQNAIISSFDFSGAFWGSGIWGQSIWSDTVKKFAQIGFDLYFKQISHRIINNLAGQYIKVNGWTYTFQNLHHQRLK